MTLDELDKLAAEKVMDGIDKSIRDDMPPPPALSFWVNAWGQVMRGSTSWQPTRNIAQAWECLEKVGYFQVSVLRDSGGHICTLQESPASLVSGLGDGAPEAIVRACLKAKGIDLENESPTT